jgi:FlaA1/EpsC-like NDP-sugar epimerase
MAVRFGNVLGSSGSAIPIFESQIKSGGPITITHPEMTRYFMSIPEASQLIIQCGALGKEGEIFLLEMGKPIKILQMAKDLIRLSGFEPEVDIPIVYTGLRPGEKLYEELQLRNETKVNTNHKKITILKSNKDEHSWESLKKQVKVLLGDAERLDIDSISQNLKKINPSYFPSIKNNDNVELNHNVLDDYNEDFSAKA